MTKTFATWLSDSSDPDLEALRQQVRDAPDDWAGIDALAPAQARIEAMPGLDEPTRRARQMDLARAFVAYHAGNRALPTRIMSFGPAIFALMFVVLGVIAFGIFSRSTPQLLDQLSDIETARGLITFIFALGVMSLALIIVSAGFVSSGLPDKSFDRARDVFTALVAILGTILGFYFGADQSGRSADAGPEPPQSALVAPGAPVTE